MTRNCAKVLPAIVGEVKLQRGVAELCARVGGVRERVTGGVVGCKVLSRSGKLIVCGSQD